VEELAHSEAKSRKMAKNCVRHLRVTLEKYDYPKMVGKDDYIERVGRDDYPKRVGRDDYLERVGRDDYPKRVGRDDYLERMGRDDYL
jgi:hypothetical protein